MTKEEKNLLWKAYKILTADDDENWLDAIEIIQKILGIKVVLPWKNEETEPVSIIDLHCKNLGFSK